MQVLLQYWKQRKSALLISLCRDQRAARQVRHILLFAEDGVVPLGESRLVELADYAGAATRLREEGFVFISEAELKLYVTYPNP